MPSVHAVDEPGRDRLGRRQDERRVAADHDDRLPDERRRRRTAPTHRTAQPAGSRRGTPSAGRRPPSPRCARISRGGVATRRRASRSSRERGRGGVDRDVGDDAARPRRHHDDAVGEEDRLGDAVGDDHDRRSRSAPRARRSSRLNRSRVSASSALNGSSSRRTSRLEREGPGERDALAHPARQLGRPAAATRRSRPTSSSSSASRARAPGGRPAGELERVGDVAGGRPPRQEPRLLEDEPDRAGRGR